MTTVAPHSRDLPLLAPEASLREAIEWAVAHATFAPSELNTQPWSFRAVVDDHHRTARLELGLDRDRVLRHLDPDRREAVVACGAALLNLRLALRAAQLGNAVLLCPDPASPDLLAAVTVRGRVVESPSERGLREAIAYRSSRLGPFERGDVPTSELDHLVSQGAYEGALVAPIDAEERVQLHALELEASSREATLPGRGEERAAWTRNNLSDADDGVAGIAHGLSLIASLAEPYRLRHGESTVSDRELEQDAQDATVVVIGSAGDDRASLLRAGAGLERLLLAATAAGISTRFVNDSLRFPDLRTRVARLVGLDHPQVVVHLGYGSSDVPTPRRPVTHVLTVENTARA